MRILSYPEAINEATRQEMTKNPNIVLLGLGVDDARGLMGSTKGLVDLFGPDRVFDTPLAEEGMTGISVGMAMSGLRPIHTHIRMEFLVLAFNQIINIASKARYMYGGKVSIPLVIRTLIGTGWGAQHSQALHSLLAHIPGLKVIAPGSPRSAKGCLVSAIRDDNPVIFIEHFNLYDQKGDVPEEDFEYDLNKSDILEEGDDVTLVGISGAIPACLEAREKLLHLGVSAEVIDLISLSKLDLDTILKSANKTKKIVVADCGWTHCGLSAEIMASLYGSGMRCERIGLAPVPCPTSLALEQIFYPNSETIKDKVLGILQ